MTKFGKPRIVWDPPADRSDRINAAYYRRPIRERFTANQVRARLTHLGVSLEPDVIENVAESLTKMVVLDARNVSEEALADALGATPEAIAAAVAEVNLTAAAMFEDLDQREREFKKRVLFWEAADERLRWAERQINALRADGHNNDQTTRSIGMIASSALGLRSVGGTANGMPARKDSGVGEED